MGDIADQMLNGTLCAGCQTYIGCGEAGIPLYCDEQCAIDHGVSSKDAQYFIANEIWSRAEQKP